MPPPRSAFPPRVAGEVRARNGTKARQQALIALADRHESVVARAQLTVLGFSDKEVKTLIRAGQLIPLHRGVYAFNSKRLSGRGHLLAALHAAGPTAFLSHRSAAAAYRLRTVNRYEIHLTLPGGSRQPRENLIFHRTTLLHPDEVRTYNGLRVSSIARMLVELTAGGERPTEIKRLITEAARHDLLQIEPLEQTLARHAGQPGIPLLAELLGDYVWNPRDRSELERQFAAFLARHPELPEPLTNVHLGPWEIDFHWPEQRLAVELDGRLYHQAVQDRERDNAKDIWLQKRRIRIMRIRDFRFEHDQPGIHRDLHDLLGLQPRAA